MSRIRLLPEDLINKIAAGEVIERPASVVKELLENALDAGARALTIDIEAGGRRRIRVADDGEGLDRDDALLALERHATSKLSSAADLARITTLGFRGEALPAIGSVSRLTLQSSRDGRSGTRVEVEGGVIRSVTDAGHPRGTTLDVRDLFFNTPARAKFLRSAATETGHISELVAAYAISLTDIQVTMTGDARRLVRVTASSEGERLRQLFGAEWDEAIPFDSRRGSYGARGWILPPGASASTRRLQHIYVNGRLVRDRTVGHAITSACEAFFPKGRHAALFLFLTCDSSALDVNVHPAKAEVRFSDGRLVHDLAQGAILTALRRSLPITRVGAMSEPAGDWGAVREPAAEWPDPSGRSHPPRPILDGARQAVGALSQGPPVEARLPEIESARVALAHYKDSYIIAADQEGLLIVDQHAAHERILYEKLMRQVEGSETGERQRLLFPVTLTLPRGLIPSTEETLAELDRLGFGAEEFGDGTVMVRESPAVLETIDLSGLLSDLLEQMTEERASLSGHEAHRHKLVATMACHAAIKVPTRLTPEKVNYLIKELFRTSSPLKCPHGRPAVLRFSHEALEKGFARR